MAVVAIISRKGGCGKSTLATHIAAYFAGKGVPITLGDLDHQQSTHTWLGRRPPGASAISGWSADTTALLRPPAGAANLVLDTAGGLQGFALSKVMMLADAIVIPVGASAFDRESSAQCWAELRAHPRVKSGRCQVACVGMRLDGRTDALQVTRDWAAAQGLPWLGSLRSAQVYVRAVDNGLSIFYMPGKATAADRSQWSPLLAWLGPTFVSHKSAAPEKPASRPAALPAPTGTPRQGLLPSPGKRRPQPAPSRPGPWISGLWRTVRRALEPRRRVGRDLSPASSIFL